MVFGLSPRCLNVVFPLLIAGACLPIHPIFVCVCVFFNFKTILSAAFAVGAQTAHCKSL